MHPKITSRVLLALALAAGLSFAPFGASSALSTAATTATKGTGPRSRRRKPRPRSAAPGTSTAPPGLPHRPLPSIRPLTRA